MLFPWGNCFFFKVHSWRQAIQSLTARSTIPIICSCRCWRSMLQWQTNHRIFCWFLLTCKLQVSLSWRCLWQTLRFMHPQFGSTSHLCRSTQLWLSATKIKYYSLLDLYSQTSFFRFSTQPYPAWPRLHKHLSAVSCSSNSWPSLMSLLKSMSHFLLCPKSRSLPFSLSIRFNFNCFWT